MTSPAPRRTPSDELRGSAVSSEIEPANRSRFGNATAIFTHTGKAAREFALRIEAGMFGID